MTSGNSALLGLAQGTVTGRETRGSSISKSPLTPVAQGEGGVSPSCSLSILCGATSLGAKPLCQGRQYLDQSAFVCDHGEEEALRKAGAHKFKPKNQVFLPAGINRHRGYDQRDQRGKLLPQTPPVAGSRAALLFSSAAFIVLCSPCHQRGWGSLPTWPGLFSSL